ncbi:MAG: hypothetical protein EPO21_22970 [Chloroflexota bacterium]|nr:MAG: hypothetical protein EPO21_22970 [Chloroflexota bacterium]
MVGRFDSQSAAVEKLGPTEDFVRLQLLLAEAETRYDPEAAVNRVIGTFLYVDHLEDLDIKVSCLARFPGTLSLVDPEMALEPRDKIHSWVKANLESGIKTILDATAQHGEGEAVRQVVAALAQTKPGMALDLALALNTEPRRDSALHNLVESALLAPQDKLDFEFLQTAIEKIANPLVRDDARLNVVEQLRDSMRNGADLQKAALPFLTQLNEIVSLGERCRACCLAYDLLDGRDDHEGLRSEILIQLHKAWEAIDVGWTKVHIGYKVASELAPSSPNEAQVYLTETDRLRDELHLNDGAAATTYIACLSLAIRAYSGLLPKNSDSSEDLDRLRELIERIPSNTARAKLWAEVVVKLWLNDRVHDCSQIASRHIRPLLQEIEGTGAQHHDTVGAVSVALYCAHKSTALEEISRLPQTYRDDAYEAVAQFILGKQPPSEPYHALWDNNCEVSYEEVVDLCELLELIDEDARIYDIIAVIANSIRPTRRQRDRFSQQQISDIADRLSRIIDNRLPNPRFIKHDGFNILARAQVARINRTGSREWDTLIAQGRCIANAADRAYVLCEIASLLPSKDQSTGEKRSQLVQEACSSAEQIPTRYDKSMRYEAFADIVKRFDPGMSKGFLKKAMEAAIESGRPNVFPIQRRIIDFAYRFDPDLASQFASMVDDDPARETMRRDLNRHLEVLKLKSKMAEGADTGAESRLNHARAAWMLLGALNASRLEPVRPEQTREYVTIASKLPLRDSYPIMSWVVENAIRRYAKTDQATTFLRPLFEATLLGTQLAWRMAARTQSRLERLRNWERTQSDYASLVVRPGERDKAIQFVKNWLASELGDYLKICDPYLEPPDLELLRLILSVRPSTRVCILTSKQHQKQAKVAEPIEDTYRTYWRQYISDQEPPETEIAVVGTKSDGVLPIHDRWWLTRGSGIRMGTSFNSLGVTRESELSIMSAEEARERQIEMDRYLERVEREHRGERLEYRFISL